MGTDTLADRIKTNDENWNEFFSRLAHAENAAAEQCQIISELFEKEGLSKLADQYRQFSSEEKNHFRLVSKICKPLKDAPAAATRIYSGALMNRTSNPIERMATIHLVFEPAALAFLGFFHTHASELVIDQSWAERIRESFGTILKDEIKHVYNGKPIIKSLLHTATDKEIRLTRQAMRRHRAFIIAGIKEMFKNHPTKKLLEIMLLRFEESFAKATKGVFV